MSAARPGSAVVLAAALVLQWALGSVDAVRGPYRDLAEWALLAAAASAIAALAACASARHADARVTLLEMREEIRAVYGIVARSSGKLTPQSTPEAFAEAAREAQECIAKIARDFEAKIDANPAARAVFATLSPATPPHAVRRRRTVAPRPCAPDATGPPAASPRVLRSAAKPPGPRGDA